MVGVKFSRPTHVQERIILGWRSQRRKFIKCFKCCWNEGEFCSCLIYSYLSCLSLFILAFCERVYLNQFAVLAVYSQDSTQVVLPKGSVSQRARWLRATVEVKAPRVCSGAFHTVVSSTTPHSVPCRAMPCCAAPPLCCSVWFHWMVWTDPLLVGQGRCSWWRVSWQSCPCCQEGASAAAGNRNAPSLLLLWQQFRTSQRSIGAFWEGKHQTLDFTCWCSSSPYWPSF